MDQHYVYFEPDPHYSEKLDSHPHENQNSEAPEAQNRAVEVRERSKIEAWRPKVEA